MKTPLIATAVVLATTAAARADEWQWFVTPYVWATDVGVDVVVDDRRVVDATIPFEDLVEDLDSAAIFQLEAMHGAHGVAIDVFNVEVADDSGRVALPSGSGSELAVDAHVGMSLVDLAGIYRIGDGSVWQGLSFRYGARVVSQREDITARLIADGTTGPAIELDVSDTLVDGLVGFRYDHALNGRWSYRIAADVSTGGTEFTWSVNPTIAYSFGEHRQYAAIAGYRYLAIDFDSKSTVDNDMTLSGLLLGLQLGF